MTVNARLSGGCQCGAVRYTVSEFGRSSLCHCRMCQKALGGPFAVLVTAKDLEYTRGNPTYFQSSNKVRRGFCKDCGSPLTFEFEGWQPDITVTSLDDPTVAPPIIQLGTESRLPWCEGLFDLPSDQGNPDGQGPISYQHPDHDTTHWPSDKTEDGKYA
ncbi:GFA family protein [Roseibium sediminis]|uniref:GFA family protein n=1 Tax=Roseibium sediminis TaxID=1775174 RepID=UPI00123D1817|nr:GFA family protein [Roseibium sediminis]